MRPMLDLLSLFTSLYAAAGDDAYPSCGDCWCVPDNGGLGPCPAWEPQSDFSSTVIDKYASQKPISYYTLECNPYEDEACQTSPPQEYLEDEDAVCAFTYPLQPHGSQSCSEYEMVSFPSRRAAERAGATVTHQGSCGLCSTTQDLSVYLGKCTDVKLRHVANFMI